MTTWPKTCHYCGAPMARGTCPRCKYRTPVQGKVVFTAPTGAAPIPPLVVTSAGAATGINVASVTIPSITVVPGGTLVVYAGITGNTSENTVSTVTWGGTPLSQTSPTFNFDSTLYADCFYLRSVAGGTHDVVATNNDPSRDASFAVANVLVGPVATTTYRQSWFSSSSSPVASASITIAIDVPDLEFHCVWIKNALVDPGSWGGGAMALQGLAIGGDFALGYISTAAGPRGPQGPITPTKALSPAAAYHWHTTEFNSP